MPRVAADDIIVVTSSSSSDEGEEGQGRSTGSSRPGNRHSAVAASAAAPAKNTDGLKRKRKEGEVETGTMAGGEVRRGKVESGEERKKEAKKKKEKKGIEDVVGSGDGFGPPSSTRSFQMNLVKGVTAGSEGGGGKNVDGTKKKKKKRKERGEQINAVESMDGGKNMNGVKKKKQQRKEEEEEINAVERMDGGKKMDGAKKKKKRKEGERETNTGASGEVRRKGEEREMKENKKKNGVKEKKPATSYAGDVIVAAIDKISCPPPTCSFPMSRVKRLIGGSEGGGSKGNVRTTTDAVFLINKAVELFLELFAQDAYVHATHEHKKAVFYKHLSSTVCNGKRYEFLSDFVPEKVRAEDALKALAEQH